MIELPPTKDKEPTEVEQGSSSQAASPSTAPPGPTIVLSPPPAPIGVDPPTGTTHVDSSAGGAPPAYSSLPTATQPIAEEPAASAPAALVARRASKSSSTSSESSRRETSAGAALKKGMLAILMAPVFVLGAGLAAMLAALYGAGKLLEGIGKGLSVGPEAAYRKYRAREERKRTRRKRSRNPV